MNDLSGCRGSVSILARLINVATARIDIIGVYRLQTAYGQRGGQVAKHIGDGVDGVSAIGVARLEYAILPYDERICWTTNRIVLPYDIIVHNVQAIASDCQRAALVACISGCRRSQ